MERPRISLTFQVFRTSQLVHSLVAEALEPTGVRGDDYAVYSYLLHGPMTLTQLAHGTGMPLTTAAGYVERFTKRGHISKSPNPADGRSHLLSLTDDCRTWILSVAAVFTQALTRVDDELAAHDLDAGVLIDQLTLVQEIIENSLTPPFSRDGRTQ